MGEFIYDVSVLKLTHLIFNWELVRLLHLLLLLRKFNQLYYSVNVLSLIALAGNRTSFENKLHEANMILHPR